MKTSLVSTGGLILPRWAFPTPEDLDDFITKHMDSRPIPGLGVCIIKEGAVAWAKGYGWADIGNKIPYDPEKTLQNIGSVSKTITATAVMQLWEQGRFKLDDDVDGYLGFKVNNPRFPEAPITFRQLLTHRSSIKDGPSYGESYACGDPLVTLKTWLEQYFTPGGEYHDAEENFHVWKPGQEGELPAQPRPYSNVGFGLLGHLVEKISKTPFSDYCREHIFEPLGMPATSWYLKDLDLSRHARPYSHIPAGESRPIMQEEGGRTEKTSEAGGFYPHCLYSFPNYPDGLVRTSVLQLARFLQAYLNEGAFENKRILKPATVRTIFSHDHFGGGLCWMERALPGGDSIWAHSGGDPGINALMCFRSSDQAGIIILANTDDAGLGPLLLRLLQEA